MAKCEIANKGIDNQAQFDIETFRNDVIAAVASMIGFPSKSGLKNAAARLQNATTRSEQRRAKKQLLLEERKYDEADVVGGVALSSLCL